MKPPTRLPVVIQLPPGYEDVTRRRFTREDYPAVDGTLDNLVRLVHARLGQAGHP